MSHLNLVLKDDGESLHQMFVTFSGAKKCLSFRMLIELVRRIDPGLEEMCGSPIVLPCHSKEVVLSAHYWSEAACARGRNVFPANQESIGFAQETTSLPGALQGS